MLPDGRAPYQVRLRQAAVERHRMASEANAEQQMQKKAQEDKARERQQAIRAAMDHKAKVTEWD